MVVLTLMAWCATALAVLITLGLKADKQMVADKVKYMQTPAARMSSNFLMTLFLFLAVWWFNAMVKKESWLRPWFGMYCLAMWLFITFISTSLMEAGMKD